jgi:hypothetical protein
MIAVSKQKLMIYAPYAIWGPHFETELEIAQRHLDDGGEVVFLGCRGGLPTCFPNQEHRQSICRMCMARFRKGMAWLGKSNVRVKDFLKITPEQQLEIDRLSGINYASCEDVRNIALEGADIGVGVISSVISILREPKPDVVKHAQLIRINLVSAANVLFSIFNHIDLERPDKFLVFNGRYAQLRPALSAAMLRHVDSCVHERAGVLDRFSLSSNTTTHDLLAIQEEILRISETADYDQAEKERSACEWYEERRNNVTQGWESFTAQQQRGHLPELSSELLNLVIFNSSEDELEAFEEWRSPFYPNQNSGVSSLLSDSRIRDKFKIFLREHPNLRHIDNTQTRQTRELARQYPELHVIPAESPVSTYSLLDQCDAVLTFGSTVGIEAAYRGKPSFLMGRAYYENLGCCVTPRSHEELIDLLLSFASGDHSMLPPSEKCRDGVIVYGIFNKLWGHAFAHVKVHGLRTVSMMRGKKSTRLRPSLISWLLFHWDRLTRRIEIL